MAMRLDRSMGSPPHPSNPTDVDEVVGRIGMAGIDAITTQAMVDQALNQYRHRQGLALGWLWRHCLTTALLAQGIAVSLNFDPAEEAYVAGLLHAIGKMALFARTPAACSPMLADPVQATPLLEAEARVVGLSQNRIGAQLIRRHTHAWLAADAARYHTVTAAKVINALPLVQVVWAANRLAGDPLPSSEVHQSITGMLKISPRQLTQLARTAEEQALAVANELAAVPAAPGNGLPADADTVPLSQEIKTGTLLSSIYGELLKATDHSAIMRVLRQSLSVFLGIDTLIMIDHEPENDMLVGRYAAGSIYPSPIHRLRIPLTASGCLPALCLAGSEPVNSFSRSRKVELTIIDQQLMACIQKDGILCVPVQSGIDSDRACLLLGIDANHWPWVAQQKTLLMAITAAVAGALEKNKRLNARKDDQAADHAASTVLRTRKIVHEINNPLSIIKNYLKVLILRSDEKSSGIEELRIIDEEINRVTGLIKSLTSPSKRRLNPLESVDVNATITEILGLFRQSLSEVTAIRLVQDLDAHIPIIASDRNRLKQALINLLKNAMEAMPEGGTIQVKTRMLKAHSRHGVSKNETDRVQISVCDDGPGIDEAVKNDLFKMNVTSKPDHDGLGLSIVHEAVTSLKGSLLCESVPGRGTCFHIELPAGGNASESETEPYSAT
jgi:signal transduction histidine kinase/HD-like signal output (HDOD) protein